MDEIDQAQVYQEDFQNFALNQQRIGREAANYTGTICLECDEEIPEKRRKAAPGCTRCISCQEDFEIHLHWRSM